MFCLEGFSFKRGKVFNKSCSRALGAKIINGGKGILFQKSSFYCSGGKRAEGKITLRGFPAATPQSLLG